MFCFVFLLLINYYACAPRFAVLFPPPSFYVSYDKRVTNGPPFSRKTARGLKGGWGFQEPYIESVLLVTTICTHASLVELVASGKVLSGLSRWKHLNVFKTIDFSSLENCQPQMLQPHPLRPILKRFLLEG